MEIQIFRSVPSKLKGGGRMEAMRKDLPEERKGNRPERNQKRGKREW